MKTYYKPTVAQGKRIIYRSIDPAEPKRQRAVRVIFLAMIVFAIGAAAWLDHERHSPINPTSASTAAH